MPDRVCTLTPRQVIELLEHVDEDGQCGRSYCEACTGIGSPCTLTGDDDPDPGPEYRRLKIAYLESLLDPDYLVKKRAEEDARYAKEPI